MKPKSTINPDYAAFVADLKVRIRSARISAAQAVNRDLILLYWDVGRAILEKQAVHGWGDSIVETLSKDLQKAFPGTQGFSIANLWRIRQFYETHTTPEFLAQAVREMASNVPWGHHVVLLAKGKDPTPHFYYFRATARFGWSRSVLLNQIKAKAYERSLEEGKAHNFPAVLPEYLAEQDNVEVEFSLKSKANPIGVAEYHLVTKLPKELKGKLPSERQLLAAVKEAITEKT